MTQRKKSQSKKQREAAQAFKRFIDFVYENPEVMRQFPRKIIFRDDAAELEFTGHARERVKERAER